MQRARYGFPLLIALVALGSLFFFKTSSSQPVGQVLYVNNTDSTCQGRSPCFATVQSAVAAVAAGDTIQIQAGTYAEQITISGKNNVTGAGESDRIVIEADSALASGSVVIDPPAASCLNGHAVLIRRSKFVTLKGLTITGAVGAGVVLLGGQQQNRGIHIEGGRIFGNSSASCPGGGIVVALGNPDTLIANTLIYGNGGNGVSFADPSGGPHWVIQNTIHANGWNGVHILFGNTVTLANNVITGNGQATGSIGGRHGVRRTGLPGQSPQAVDLFNNLVCGNRLGEISGPILDSTDTANLTPAGSEGPGVSASPGCQIPANVYANSNGADGQPNTADDDFTPSSSSPAIDRGLDPRTLGLNALFNPVLESDYLATAIRPADGNTSGSSEFDIGALEFATPNQPPVADAGLAQTVARGTLVTLDGTQSSDPEGAPLTFSWTILSQPSGSSVTLTNANSANPTFTPLRPGSYVIQLIVNDGQLDSTPDTVTVTATNASPTANAGGPYSGQAGQPIQFSGSGSDPEGDSLTFSWDFGDGSTPLTTSGGTVSTPTHTYATAGTFTVTLTVSDPFGGIATSQTSAAITERLVLNPIGNKTVNLGETLSFTVTATGPAGQAIRLFVAPLPLPNHATFNAATGEFRFTPDTLQVGSFELTFTATGAGQSASETITINVPSPPPDGITAVRGRVYNLNNTPLGNVKVTLKSSGHTAFSSDTGYFTISGVSSGRQELIVNGREANLGVFAILAVPVDLIAGVLNHLPSPITLPDVDVDAEVQVSQTFTTVVSNPNVPGVELTILGGTARNSDGTPFTGKLSINPVPDYGRPESRPEELRPGMAITIQPAGVRFNPPARLTFPNADNMPPGNELNLWSLSPDTGTFSIVGKMVVSSDGSEVITIEGGVTSSAWHFPLASSPVPSGNQGNNFCGSCRSKVGSEANIEEGSLYLTHSLPSHRSLGQSRTVSLTYSSLTADPRPIISLDTTLSVRAAVPNSYSTRLEVGGVQQGGEIFTDTSLLPEDSDSTSRVSAQFDASNLPTGRYPYQATVFSNYLNSSIGGITTGSVIVVNNKASYLGSGWTVTDLHQLHVSVGGALLTKGNGTALFFSGGPDAFTSPAGDFSVLRRNPDGTYTRTLKDGTKINFNTQGLQLSVLDRNGNTTSYAYDGSGRLLAITDPAALVTTFTYAGSRLQKITDPAGRETSFQHNSAGNLIKITNPDGTFRAYAYDSKGHATQAADERGNATSYAYDFAGRFAQSTRPTGETRALRSSKLQGLADVEGGQGTPTNPASAVSSQNATASLTDGNGQPTRFTLDGLGQIVSQQDALGQTTLIQRESNGNPTRITRPNGAVTAMTYDNKGNLLTSTDPVGATTTFTYEPNFNQVKTIRDPKGNTTTINYDAKGNPIEIIDALGTRTQMTYDARGLLTSVTSALGKPEQNTTSFTYDARGNLLTTTDPLNNVTALAYDNAGNVIRSTDAENRVTEFTYDPMNRIAAVTDADLKITTYSYDGKGNLTEVRDAKSQITTFAYDSLDRLIGATNPLNLTEIFAYDANGNLTSSTNRNGQTLSFNYDALNRLIQKTRPPTSTEVGPQVTTFDYDEVGNLSAVINPTTGVFNQYDLANRLISSISSTEGAVSGTVTQINTDTLIDENNFQFEGKTLQVNGRTLTVNGTHTFANVTLTNGAVLTHSPTTATKVNKLEITVTGSLQIDSTSRIDVNGRGYLGGKQPGNPFAFEGMTVGFAGGSTIRTGGSYGGLGGPGFSGNGNGVANPVYGDFRNPTDVGSGGGNDLFGGPHAGGNGGGLVRIVAQTLQLDGIIMANGARAIGDNGGGGSGGGIRIDVGTIQGSGQISANGGEGSPKNQANVGDQTGGGGGGRVAVYYQTAIGFNFGNVTATGSIGHGAPNGGAGTVYLQGPTRENGELIVDNSNSLVPSLSTPIPGALASTVSLTHLRVRRGARASLDSTLNLTGTLEVATNGEFTARNPIASNSISLTSNGILTHRGTTGAVTFKVEISAQVFTIDSTSRIDVNGRGYLGGKQPGNSFAFEGMTVGFARGSAIRTGGSYGGLGGPGFSGNGNGVANPVYGDFRNPNDAGSGGGNDLFGGAHRGGNGGGLVRIIAQTLQLDGAIRANGASATGDNGGGGSGGGIRIDVEALQGSGQISANGGDGSPKNQVGVGDQTGGGGGGRIAIYYQNAAGFNLANVRATGGIGHGAPNGGAGTVYLQGPTRENGELVVDNSDITAPSLSTPMASASSSTTLVLTHLRVRRAARAGLSSPINLTGALEVAMSGEVAVGHSIISNSLSLTNNAILTHFSTTGTTTFKVDIIAQTLAIDDTSRIDVNGRGYLGGKQPGNPFAFEGMTVGFARGSTIRTGGSYGGLGGAGFNASGSGVPNAVYGDFRNPNDVGSGGGNDVFNGQGGNGGGLVRIVAQMLQLDGAIRGNGANGAGNDGGGGSGGGIRIDVGTLQGVGQISANGGNSSVFNQSGGGGGGRVTIYHQNATGFNFANVEAAGGTGSGAPNGQNGTVHFEQTFAMLRPFHTDRVLMTAKLESLLTTNDSESNLSLVSKNVGESPNPTQRRVLTGNLQLPDNSFIQKSSPLVMLTQTAAADACCLSPTEKDRASELLTARGSPPADTDPIYTYDLNGNRTSMIDPTGLTTYTYDALNRLTSITNNRGQVTSFAYDSLGRRTSMTHSNGVVTSYTYDAASQLKQLKHQLGAAVINSFDYTYDNVGNRKTKVDRNGSYNYTYDAVNRLTEALNPLPSNPLESFNYDPVGNRTNSNQNGPSTFNQANQLLEDANFIYQYDNNGNLILKTPKISGPITSYEYDAENKLVRVVSNGTTANYKYDGLGRRVEKEIVSASTMVTRYVYDNEDILFELESANNIVARYTHGPGIDEPLIMEKAGAPFFYHSDGLGSITDITNQSGVVVQRYPYSSFGKIESQSDPNFVQPYAFTARELDPEIELYHFRRRAFRPAAGRFLQSDPLDLLFAQTNLYVYVRNNPTSYIDPTGQVLFAPIFKLLGSNLDEAMLQSSIFSTMPSLLHRAGLVEFPCPIEELFGNFEPALTVSEIASGLTLAFRTAPYLAAAGAGNGIIAGYIIPVSTAFLGGLSAGAAINDFVIAPLTGGPTFKESMRILLGPP